MTHDTASLTFTALRYDTDGTLIPDLSIAAVTWETPTSLAEQLAASEELPLYQRCAAQFMILSDAAAITPEVVLTHGFGHPFTLTVVVSSVAV